jgi:hypothetical protein
MITGEPGGLDAGASSALGRRELAVSRPTSISM